MVICAIQRVQAVRVYKTLASLDWAIGGKRLMRMLNKTAVTPIQTTYCQIFFLTFNAQDLTCN